MKTEIKNDELWLIIDHQSFVIRVLDVEGEDRQAHLEWTKRQLDIALHRATMQIEHDAIGFETMDADLP